MKNNKSENDSFIIQTAKDYDMQVHKVYEIYKKWNDENLFYEKLEEYLIERRYRMGFI